MQPAEIFASSYLQNARLSKRVTTNMIDDEFHQKSRELGRKIRNLGINYVINLVRPNERDLSEIANAIQSLLIIIDENEPRLRQDIQIIKQKYDDSQNEVNQLRKKLQSKTDLCQNQYEEIEMLKKQLKIHKTEQQQLVNSALYQADTAYMHRKIAMDEVEKVRECFNCTGRSKSPSFQQNLNYQQSRQQQSEYQQSLVKPAQQSILKSSQRIQSEIQDTLYKQESKNLQVEQNLSKSLKPVLQQYDEPEEIQLQLSKSTREPIYQFKPKSPQVQTVLSPKQVNQEQLQTQFTLQTKSSQINPQKISTQDIVAENQIGMQNINLNQDVLNKEIQDQYSLINDLTYSKRQFELEREQNNYEIAKEYARLTQERRLAQMETSKLLEEKELLERERQRIEAMRVACKAAGIYDE